MDLNIYTARTLLGLLLLDTFGLIIVCISQHFKHKKFRRLATRKYLTQERELKEAAKDIEFLKAQCQAYQQKGVTQASEPGVSIAAEIEHASCTTGKDNHLSLLPYHNSNVTIVHRVASQKGPPDEGPTILDRILADDT